LWDYDFGTSDDFAGFAELTVAELTKRNVTNVLLSKDDGNMVIKVSKQCDRLLLSSPSDIHQFGPLSAPLSFFFSFL
jgi:hypothetical protein